MTKYLALGCWFLASLARADAPLETVAHVDLQKYLGDWYEQARLPNSFQEGCTHAKANYSVRPDGKLKVVNTCRRADGSMKEAEGEAEVVDKETNAKLSVSFVPSWMRWTGVGRGKYWIIDLHPKYEYAVVSEPERRYLWILSRAERLDRKTYDAIVERLKKNGFDTSKLLERGKEP